MSTQEAMSTEDLLALPMDKFIDRCKEWRDEFNDGRPLETSEEHICPVQSKVIFSGKICNKDTVPHIGTCPVCDQPVCPDCMNHEVHQLSRVTGYISNVGGWNEAKKQELKDRCRSDLR